MTVPSGLFSPVLMKRILLISLLFISISGCALFQSLSSVQSPSVSYKDFHVDGFSFQGMDLLFDFDVTNPNNVDIRAESYQYEFFINDESLISGNRTDRVEIPASNTQMIQVPVSMNFQELYRAGRSVLDRDSIRYQLATEVEFDLPVLGSRRIPVRAEGYLPVIRIPEISFEGFDIRQLSLNGAEFAARIRVVNPNTFGFSFRNVGYRLEVNDSEWVDSTLSEPLQVEANSDTEIEIPVRLSGASLGTAVLQILSGNQVFNYSISGGGEIDLDLPFVRDTAFLPFNLSGQHRLSN
jgi:LEA14-like dessication related protein